MTDMQLILVRHGETEWIERGLIHGRMDSPLSENGKRNAARAAHRLRGVTFDALYASSSGRALQTAGIIGEAVGLKPIPVDGLRELDFGWFEGRALSLLDVNVSNPFLKARNSLARLVMGLTGESYRNFTVRIRASLDAILSDHPGGRVLIVTHWGVLSRLVFTLLAEDQRRWKDYGPWGACSISELHLLGGKWQAVRLNDLAHLNHKDGQAA